jgi:hypothetical protein
MHSLLVCDWTHVPQAMTWIFICIIQISAQMPSATILYPTLLHITLLFVILSIALMHIWNDLLLLLANLCFLSLPNNMLYLWEQLFFILFTVIYLVLREGSIETVDTLGIVVHNCITSTQEAEARMSWVLGQLGLHSKTLVPNKNQKPKQNKIKSRCWIQFSWCRDVTYTVITPSFSLMIEEESLVIWDICWVQDK